MRGIHAPDAFPFLRLAPVKFPARAVQLAEHFGHMRGMETDQPHPLPYVLNHTPDNLIPDLAVSAMPPPQQDIRIPQDGFGKPVFPVLPECRKANLEIRMRNSPRNCFMKSAGIHLRSGFIRILMDELIPDRNLDFIAHGALLQNRYTFPLSEDSIMPSAITADLIPSARVV